MKAEILTAQQIKESEGRNYNPQIWESNVDRMVNNYTDVVFYRVEKDSLYQYERYYVEYTLNTGLRLLGQFSYSSGLTNGGFYRLDKTPVTEDGKRFMDAVSFIEKGDGESANALFEELRESRFVELTEVKFREKESGDMVMINTSKEARDWMTALSKELGIVFTKGF